MSDREGLREWANAVSDSLARCALHFGPVLMFSELYTHEIATGCKLYELLFSPDWSDSLDRDARERLRLGLDRCRHWDAEVDLGEIEPTINGVPRLAPSVALAQRRTLLGYATACVAMDAGHAASRATVATAEGAVDVHFVRSQSTILAFYRSIPSVDGLNEADFLVMARLAFPDLTFAPTLRFNFSGPYAQMRDKVSEHLSAINDHWHACWSDSAPPDQVIARMRGLGHIDISRESPNTHANQAAMRAREVRIGEGTIVCEWHSKIDRTIDRIYFAAGDAASGRRPLVGIFHAHLPT